MFRNAKKPLKGGFQIQRIFSISCLNEKRLFHLKRPLFFKDVWWMAGTSQSDPHSKVLIPRSLVVSDSYYTDRMD